MGLTASIEVEASLQLSHYEKGDKKAYTNEQKIIYLVFSSLSTFMWHGENDIFWVLLRTSVLLPVVDDVF